MAAKIFSSKKGVQAGKKVIFYIFFGFLLTIAGFVIVYVSYSNLSEIAEIPVGLEKYTLEQRFFLSDECFLYQNNNRAYPYTIEWSSFTNESVAKCYQTKDLKQYSFSMILKNSETNEELNVATPNWNNIARASHEVKVTILKEGKKYPGVLTINAKN